MTISDEYNHHQKSYRISSEDQIQSVLIAD